MQLRCEVEIKASPAERSTSIYQLPEKAGSDIRSFHDQLQYTENKVYRLEEDLASKR